MADIFGQGGLPVPGFDEETDPIGVLMREKAKRQQEEAAKISAQQQAAQAQQQSQDQNRARQELESLRSGRAITPPSIPQARAVGQKIELGGGEPKSSKDVDNTPSNNIDSKTSDGHGPITAVMQDGRMIFTNLGAQYAAKGAEDIGYERGIDMRNADEHPGSRRNVQAIHQLEASPDNWANRPEPQVDLNAFTQGSLAQNDIYQQDKLKRAQVQEATQNISENSELGDAERRAKMSEAGAREETPFIEQYIKNRGALDVANAEGGSRIAAAQQPGLISRQTEQERIAGFARDREQAKQQLMQQPGFAQLLKVNPTKAQELIDDAAKRISEPRQQGMTKYDQRSTGFANY